MAEIHAIQDGNWEDSSTWDLGRTPTVNDDVYISTHVSLTDNVSANTITISDNGYISYTSSTILIQADVVWIGTNNYAINGGSATRRAYLNGNVTCSGSGTFATTITIVGNVTLNSGQLLCGGYLGIPCSGAINGNIEVYGGFISGIQVGYSTETIEIMGDITIYESAGTIFGQLTRNGLIAIYGKLESYSFSSVFTNVRMTRQATPCIFGGDVILHNATSLYGGYIQDSPTVIIFDGNVDIPNGDIFPIPTACGSVYINKQLTTKEIPREQNAKYIYDTEAETRQLVTSSVLLATLKTINYPTEQSVAQGVTYGMQNEYEGRLQLPAESVVVKGVEYGDKVGTLEVIALSGATATADNISVVNLTEQEVNRVKNCATVSTVQKCFEDFKEE